MKGTLAKLYEAEGAELSTQGNYDDAIDSFTKAIRLGGTGAALYVQRALAYSAIDRNGSALDDLDAAVRHDPENAEAYLRRAEIFVRSNEMAKALADLDRALRLRPNDTEALQLRAVTREAAGEMTGAAADYQSVVEHDPGNRIATSGLRRIGTERESLARLLQIELTRVGCDPGPIDGQWGAKTREALKAFAEHAGVSLQGLDASEANLKAVSAGDDETCPVTDEEMKLEVKVKPREETCITINDTQYCDFTSPHLMPVPFRDLLGELAGNTLLCTEKNIPHWGQAVIYVTAQRIYVGHKLQGKIIPHALVFVLGEKTHFDGGKTYNVSNVVPLSNGVQLSNFAVTYEFTMLQEFPYNTDSHAYLRRSNGKWTYQYKADHWIDGGRHEATVPHSTNEYDCELTTDTFAGAGHGSQIGKSLDKADKALAQRTAQNALEYNKTGQASTWRNPESGHSGTVTPVKTYRSAEGEDCRTFETSINVNGKQEQGTGNACRQPDGTWKIGS